MRSSLFALLLLSTHISLCQNCTCKDKLKFVKDQVTANYAGFNDKVTNANRKTYEAFTEQHMQKAENAAKPAACLMLMYDWLAFFKDGHIQLAGNQPDKDSIAVQARIKNTETIHLSEAQINALKKSSDPIEGIYADDDSTYTIAIIKNKNEYRDYAGVMITSRMDTWKPGQVKLELKTKSKDRYVAVAYMSDHSARVHDFIFDGRTFNDIWIKAGKKNEPKREAVQAEPVAIRKINDHTLYLQIRTFDGSIAGLIHSVMEANVLLLKTLPNLIIDIRGNGGGSDYSFRSIRPWLYTNPIIRTGVDVRATRDNIDGWRNVIMDNPDMPADIKEQTKPLLEEMEHHIGKFVSAGENDTTTMDKMEPNPQKVVILMNEECASSAEQFLLEARQSKKVTLIGRHSKGVLDYANMRPSATPPCNDLALYYATTRSRRIDMRQGIDNVGIQPDITLSKDKDWIAEAVKYMDSK